MYIFVNVLHWSEHTHLPGASSREIGGSSTSTGLKLVPIVSVINEKAKNTIQVEMDDDRSLLPNPL